MKRSKTVQLLLISTSPFYLTACNQNYDVQTITNTFDYPSVQACLDAKQDAPVCARALATTRQIEKQNPVRYSSLDNCLEDFPAHDCEGDTNGAIAKAAGFELIITKQQWVDKAGQLLAKDPRTFGSWSHKDLAETQYAARPLYTPKVGRTPPNLVATTENLSEQQQAAAASSAGSSGSHYVGGGYYGGIGRSFTGSQSSFQPQKRTNSSVRRYASSTSRGGFGGYSSRSSSSHSFFGG